LGKFARFDPTRCRWTFENGTDATDCSLDAYGQPRRRGWVDLECNRDVAGRAQLVAASEPRTCEYALIVQSPEVCG
jgi:hypothetical protein